MKLKTLIFLTTLISAMSWADPLSEINDEYKGKIKPLLKNNCLSCHGNVQLSPWYRELPGVSQYIDGHIFDAKNSLDMASDIPFKGKGIQSDIFWSIITSIKKERMPPKSFSILHQDIKFKDDERKLLIEWFSNKRKELLEHDL